MGQRRRDHRGVLGSVPFVHDACGRIARHAEGVTDDPTLTVGDPEVQPVDVGVAIQERGQERFGRPAGEEQECCAQARIRHSFAQRCVTEALHGPLAVVAERGPKDLYGARIVERLATGGLHVRAIGIDARLAEEGVGAEAIQRNRWSWRSLEEPLGSARVERGHRGRWTRSENARDSIAMAGVCQGASP